MECAPSPSVVEQVVAEVGERLGRRVDAGAQQTSQTRRMVLLNRSHLLQTQAPSREPVVEKPKVKTPEILKFAPSAVQSNAQKNSGAGADGSLVASPDPAEAGKVERKARALGLNTSRRSGGSPGSKSQLYKVRVGPFIDKFGGVEALRRIKR